MMVPQAGPGEKTDMAMIGISHSSRTHMRAAGAASAPPPPAGTHRTAGRARERAAGPLPPRSPDPGIGAPAAFVRHTAAMRHLGRPGLLTAPAALAVAGCLALAACGGGGGHHATARPPAASATAAAEPAAGPAAVAAITANWKTVFDGKAPIPERLALSQDGAQLSAFILAQARTSLGQAATGSSATVTSVTITSPGHATVHYAVLLLGTPLLKDQAGVAVYQDGIWKVGIATTCGLAVLAYSPKSSALPAICRS
jgi:hypothetical protein